jgi:hypothetical protein
MASFLLEECGIDHHSINKKTTVEFSEHIIIKTASMDVNYFKDI